MSTDALPFSRLLPASEPITALEAKLRGLIERVKENDATAFDDLYRLTRDDVAKTLFHLLGQRSDLEDLIQEVYCQLLKSAHRFRGESQFRTFLYRLCSNVALMHLRWWRRRREELVDEVPEQIDLRETGPEARAQATQAHALVHRALSTLSAKKRIVFVYSELCGMGPDEISEATGTPYNTVRSRLHHARLEFTAVLRRLLEAQP